MAVGRQLRILGVVVCLLVASLGLASAQSVSSGTIHGTVRDQSGGVLPGVTATLTSPALQVRELVQVTDAEGAYRFVDLPAGTYLLKFELTGFSTLIREDLRLTIGFTARVDESMKVGAMEESVTVSGQSPIVDITSTSASVAFTKEILENVPRGRDLQNVLAMAPGVTQAHDGRRRQHTGAAAGYGELRHGGAAQAPVRRHEHRDGRRSEHAHLLHRQQPRRGAGPDIGQRRRGVDAWRLDDCDHEVGRATPFMDRTAARISRTVFRRTT